MSDFNERKFDLLILTELLVVGGSRAYGMHTDESDVDVHIAATSDGKELRIYVDGAMKSSAVIPRAIIPSPSPLRIGAGYFDPGRRFHGLIDEVAIFDRALDPTEIWFLYRYGMQGKPLRN